MTKCKCGGEPLTLVRRKRGGRTAFAMKCDTCGKRTHWHRPNGGHVHEWRQMNERNTA